MILKEFLYYNKKEKYISKKDTKLILEEIKIAKNEKKDIVLYNIDNKHYMKINVVSDSVSIEGYTNIRKGLKKVINKKIVSLFIYHNILSFNKFNENEIEFLEQFSINDRIYQRGFFVFDSFNDFFMEYIHNVKTDDYILKFTCNTIVSEIKETVSSILPDIIFDSRYEDKKFSFMCDNNRVNHIIGILETRYNEKNYRIIVTNNSYKYNNTIQIYSIPEDLYELYVLMELNRCIINDFYGDSIKCVFDDNMCKIVNTDNDNEEENEIHLTIDHSSISNIIRNLNNMSNQEYFIISPQVFRFYSKKDNDNIEYKTNAIIEKYKTLLSDGKTITIDGAKINKTSIQITDNLHLTFDEKFINVINELQNIRGIIKDIDKFGNINEMYEKILGYSKIKYIRKYDSSERGHGYTWSGPSKHYREYSSIDIIKYKINDIDIVVKHEHYRWYVNDIFVRIDDIKELLYNAICSQSKEDYTEYLRNISSIGLEWKKIISNGINIEISNPLKAYDSVFKRKSEPLYMRFSFIWDLNKRSMIYIVLNDKKFKITQKRTFLSQMYAPTKYFRSFYELKNVLDKCVDLPNEFNIEEFIDNGQEEFKIVKERAERLVEQTVKNVNAKKGKLETNHSTYDGYYLNGRISNSEYFIDGSNLAVWKKQNGKWNKKCVVDQMDKNRIFNDRLANRLVNIYNEPKRIYTIQ
ncbi:MAG: hypothetical protein ACOCV1_04395 [Bacillota bacterium]